MNIEVFVGHVSKAIQELNQAEQFIKQVQETPSDQEEETVARSVRELLITCQQLTSTITGNATLEDVFPPDDDEEDMDDDDEDEEDNSIFQRSPEQLAFHEEQDNESIYIYFHVAANSTPKDMPTGEALMQHLYTQTVLFSQYCLEVDPAFDDLEDFESTVYMYIGDSAADSNVIVRLMFEGDFSLKQKAKFMVQFMNNFGHEIKFEFIQYQAKEQLIAHAERYLSQVSSNKDARADDDAGDDDDEDGDDDEWED